MASRKSRRSPRRRNPFEQLQLGSTLFEPSDDRREPRRAASYAAAAAKGKTNRAYQRRLEREAAFLAGLVEKKPRKPRKPSKPKKAAGRPKAKKGGKLTGAAKKKFLARMAAGRKKAGRASPKKRAAAPRKKKGGTLSKKAFLARMAAGRRKAAAAKLAFVRRMAKARGAWRPHSKAHVQRAQARKGVKKHLRAITQIQRRQKVAGLVRLNPKTGRKIMAKVANPGKKHHHKRRARNPSFGGLVSTFKTTLPPMVLGGAAGGAAGYVDAKWLGDKPTMSILAKVGLAVLGAMFLGRKHPMAAAGFTGGLVGSIGYKQGVKFGGGMVGLSPSSTLKGLADMAADDPQMAATIAGLGDIVPNQIGDVSDEPYSQALADAEDMGDLVEAN